MTSFITWVLILGMVMAAIAVGLTLVVLIQKL